MAALALFALAMLLPGCNSENKNAAPQQLSAQAPVSDCAAKFGDEKALCFGATAVRDKNALICETGEISASSGCMEYFAFETKDLGACANPTVEFDQSDCYVNYAQKTNDTGVCEKAVSADGLAKVNCYANLAGILKDTALCGKLDTAHFGLCISEVASQKAEPNDCKLITDAPERDTCYWKVSMAMHDPEVCAPISDANFMQFCLDSISEGIATAQTQQNP